MIKKKHLQAGQPSPCGASWPLQDCLFCLFLSKLLLWQDALHHYLLNSILVSTLHRGTRVSVQSARPSTISVSLRTKLPPITRLAEESSLILITKRAVQPLVTNTCKVLITCYTGIKQNSQHLKQALCHLWPPAIFSSAANTVLVQAGHEPDIFII